MITYVLRFATALLLVLVVSGCGDPDGGTQGRLGKGGVRYGGIYRMNVLRGSPNGLDPVLIESKHADDIASQIYDKLIDLDPKLQLVPELARTLPEVSSDLRVYRFHLRDDVYFHDDSCFPGARGRRLVAADVKYSFTRCCDPRTSSVAYWAFLNKVVGATEYNESIKAKRPIAEVKGFRAVDDTTFEIELIAPYVPFMYYLVNSLGSVVPHEAVERYGANFFRHPVGSGPFIFASWSQDQELTLRRNPKYWGRDGRGNRLPFLDEIRFLFIRDDKVQFNEFLAGNLEESYNVPTELFTDVFDPATGKGRAEYSKYQLQSVPAMLTWFCDFLTTKPPFDNVAVRRAFNYAIDREKIVRYVLQGSPYGAATHGIVPPVFGAYPTDSVQGYVYDAKRAQDLLASAGFPGGRGFPPVTLNIYPEPRLQQVAEAMQEMLKRTLNIQVEIRITEFPQLLQQAEAGKLALWGTRWYGDYPDPETFLNLFNGTVVPRSEGTPSYPNSSRYRSAAYDREFLAGVKTIDNLARMTHYLAAERIAVADAPFIPLLYERHLRLLQPNVHDNPLDAMARYDLKNVWME